MLSASLNNAFLPSLLSLCEGFWNQCTSTHRNMQGIQDFYIITIKYYRHTFYDIFFTNVIESFWFHPVCYEVGFLRNLTFIPDINILNCDDMHCLHSFFTLCYLIFKNFSNNLIQTLTFVWHPIADCFLCYIDKHSWIHLFIHSFINLFIHLFYIVSKNYTNTAERVQKQEYWIISALYVVT